MKAAIYYWKDPKYLLLGMPLSPLPMPTQKDIPKNYKVIWQGDVPENTTRDELFERFNFLPVPFRLPPGIKHTSMSIGDIVQLDDIFYICMPLGWKKVKS